MRYDEVTASYNAELHAEIAKLWPGRDLDEESGLIPFITGYCAEIEVGEIDSQAISCFSRGNCGALALAIAEITGWELVLLHGSQAGITWEPERTWLHALVRMPSGKLVDITGAMDEKSAAAEWPGRGEITFETVTTEQMMITVMDENGWDNYMPIEAALIRDFARVLVRQVGQGALLAA